MVHIIYSIAYCNIKLHNCPPLLLGPFRLPPGSVLALKEDQPFQSPISATFLKLGNGRVKPQAREGYLASNSEGSHFFSMCRVDGGIMRQHLLWDSLSFTCLIKLKETYLDYCSFAQKRCPLITSKNF